MEQAIYFDDLSEETKQRIKNQFNTTPEREFWDLFPLLILRKKIPGKEK
ncbi:MAG: hypothetical protein JEZ11_17905 [Desulfobacterales bacterium]|nr:hypothetical protein [Desulfobacterales bacterium]